MSKSDISDFVMQPLHKKLNRENLVSRMEKLEAGESAAAPSARVDALGEMGQSTGSLIVDELIVVNHDTGEIAVVIGASGITLENGDTLQYFVFKDSNGNPTMYIASGSDDSLILANTTAGKDIRFEVKQTNGTVRFISISEDAANANVLQLDLGVGGGAAKLTMGGALVIWADKDGVETVFNDDSFDIDHRWEGATDANLLFLDAGNNRVGVGDSTPSYKLDVVGDINSQGATYKIDGVTAFPIQNDESVMDSTGFTISSTDFQDTGLFVTLPAAGTYRIHADVRGALRPNGGAGTTTWWVSAELYNATDAAAVANSERLVVLTTVNSQLNQMTCPINQIVTVAASKQINLYAQRDGNGTPAWTTTTIESNVAGRTVLSWEKIG